jgi:hypothetical protein
MSRELQSWEDGKQKLIRLQNHRCEGIQKPFQMAADILGTTDQYVSNIYFLTFNII